jgi:Tfp pilus assembly protein FimT
MKIFEDYSVPKGKVAPTFLGRSRKTQQIQGATLAEVLVAIVIVGVLGAIAAPNILAKGNKSLQDTRNQLAGQFRSMRSRAVSQTAQFRLRPTNEARTASVATCALNPAPTTNACVKGQFIVERSTTNGAACDAATGWVQDQSFLPEDLTFDSGIEVSKAQVNPVVGNTGEVVVLTNWQLCFNSRGIADKNLVLTLRQSGNSKIPRIEIFPGGSIQTYDN